MQNTPIKFIVHMDPYMKGEVAGFPEGRAQELIARGYAVAVVSHRAEEAARLKHLATAPETRHIPGPEQTKAAPQRRCSLCGNTGHSKNNCPKKSS